jgi:hypothetical protein
MSKRLSIQLLVWFVALLALGLAGFWFFRGATAWSTAALAIAVIFYVGAMVGSCYVSVRRHYDRNSAP